MGMRSNVAGGLPPIAVCQLIQLALNHRHRGQAPSHILITFQFWICFGSSFVTTVTES